MSSPDLDPTTAAAAALEVLDAKIRRLLPPRYEHCYEAVRPVSMGSAGLKYDAQGRVDWGGIWTSFCDLALAGGPPHRGTWLPPPDPAEVERRPAASRGIAEELVRAIPLASAFVSAALEEPGWVGVTCGTLAESAWLRAAIVAENVSARRRGTVLLLPAGPDFRVEKEVKNVVVALAKTSHYFDGHLSEAQQSVFQESAFPEPASPAKAASPEYAAAADLVEARIAAAGMQRGGAAYAGWFGVACGSEEEAAWLLRATVVEGVLVRREGGVLYLPVGAGPRSDAERVADVFAAAVRLSRLRGAERSEPR